MHANLCFGFSTKNWKDLSHRLDSDESLWAEAVGVFERRMRERFLSSIDALIVADTKPDSQSEASVGAPHCVPGFAIMALCCLLIETLQGFREDPPSAVDPIGPCAFPPGPCIRPPSGTNQHFIRFLQRPAFNGAFNHKVAKRFNSGIRNGILHEAETRRWVIWRDEPVGAIVAPEDDGYALNRSLFYAAVKREFESYLSELCDPANQELRQRFKEKMDHLSGKA